MIDTEFRHLIKTLEGQVIDANVDDDDIGAQRDRNHRYYTLQPLGNEQTGRSQYVSPDVMDVVESKKAFFAETFLSARQVVRFTPETQGTKSDADAKTAYVNKVLQENNIEELLRDGWHDAFVAKRMVVLAEWENDTEEEVQTVQAMPAPQLHQLMQQDPMVLDLQPTEETQVQEVQGPQGQLMQVISGDLMVTKDASHIALTLIQPERYFRDPQVPYVRDAGYAGYDEDLSRGEMLLRGYDLEQVKTLAPDYQMAGVKDSAGRRAHDGGERKNTQGLVTEQETVTVYRTWTWLDENTLAGSAGMSELSEAGPGLYEIHWASGEVLIKDGSPCIYEAQEMPFFEWTEYKISHADQGLAVSDVVAHTQKTSSTLKRLVLDNQQMRNTSRMEAVVGAVQNPRDLLDNKIGGVVWTKRLGSVAPLVAPELSGMTFQVIEMLAQDKEERAGLSRLSQGLNTDVLGKQNAADMVARLTNASNRRVMRAARDFAQTFLVPLCRYVYRLGARHDTRLAQVEVSGQFQQVNPAQWEDKDIPMRVHAALTPEEALTHAQGLLMMHQAILGSAQLGSQLPMLYGLEQQHALMDDVFDAFGVVDSSRYLMRPDTPQFQQMMQQQQQQQMQAKQEADLMKQFQFGLLKSGDQRSWFEAKLKGQEAQVNAADKASDNLREDEKFNWKKNVDSQELVIEKQQRRGVDVGG